VETNRLR
jgi:hypothetical protein